MVELLQATLLEVMNAVRHLYNDAQSTIVVQSHPAFLCQTAEAPVVKIFPCLCIVYFQWSGFACVRKGWVNGNSVSGQLPRDLFRCEISKINHISGLAVRLDSGTQVFEVNHLFQSAANDVDKMRRVTRSCEPNDSEKIFTTEATSGSEIRAFGRFIETLNLRDQRRHLKHFASLWSFCLMIFNLPPTITRYFNAATKTR